MVNPPSLASTGGKLRWPARPASTRGRGGGDRWRRRLGTGGGAESAGGELRCARVARRWRGAARGDAGCQAVAVGAPGREGSAWARRAGTRVAARGCGRAALTNPVMTRGGGQREFLSDGARTRPTARRGEGARVLTLNFGGEAYLYIEGARRLQMECGFRPHDHDRTTESMEGS